MKQKYLIRQYFLQILQQEKRQKDMIKHIYLKIVKNGIYQGIKMVILNKHKKNMKNNKVEQIRYREKNINKIYNIIKLFDEK